MLIGNKYGEALIHALCGITATDTETHYRMLKAYKTAKHRLDNFENGYKERFKEFNKKRKNNPYFNLIDRSVMLNYLIQIFYNDEFVEGTGSCEGYGKLIEFIYSLDCDLDRLDDKLDELTDYYKADEENNDWDDESEEEF